MKKMQNKAGSRRKRNYLALVLATTCLTALAGMPAMATTIFTDANGNADVNQSVGCPAGTASGTYASAIGCGSDANGDYSVSLGSASTAAGSHAVAIGGATANGNYTTIIGASAEMTGDYNFVVGTSAGQGSSGQNNLILGTSAAQNFTGSGNFIAGGSGNGNGVAGSAKNVTDSIVIGPKALQSVSGVTRAVVLGSGATVGNNSSDTVAIGTLATGASSSVALGNKANAAANGVAIGSGAKTTKIGSVAIGTASDDQGRGNVVSFGSSGSERQLTNVAAGTADTDGVNVSQLKGVTTALGGGASVGSNGSIVAPTYNIGGNTYHNVGDALTNVDGRTTQNSTSITNLDNRVTNVEGDVTTVTGDVNNILDGKAGIVRQVGGAPGSGTITVGAETGGTLVDMAGTDGKRKVTGVADGDVSSTSFDAVNGSQLSATNANVTNNTTSITNLQGNALQWNTILGAYDASHGSATPQKIANVADGVDANDAVNKSQLDAVNATVGQGWNLQANGDTATQVKPGGTVQLKDGKNIKVSRNGTDVTIATADDLNANSLTSGNTTVNTNGVTITNSGNQSAVLSATGLSIAGGPSVTLSGIDAGSKKISNVADGDVSSGSKDAVNGSQLYSTNQNVQQNTVDIANLNTTVNNVTGDITNIKGDVTNLTTTVNNQGGQIASLDKAAVKYTLDSNGNATNEVKLSGDGSGAAVVIKNVATGVDATDAVNVGQLRDAVNGLSSGDPLGVKYVGDSNGKATNTVALTGDGSGSSVTIQNVAAGTKDTDASNYGQIKNQVAYDTDSSGTRTNTITLSGNNGASVVLSNVGDGVADHDAANIKQLNGVRSDAYAYTDKKVGELRDYTDARLDSLSGNIRSVQSEARAGISGVAAQSQLRYADKPGVLSVAAGLGGFKGSSALAAGLGWTSQDQAWRVNGSVGVSLNTGDVTWGVGASYAFD